MIQTLFRTARLRRTWKKRGMTSRIFSFILRIAVPVRVDAQGRMADSPGPLLASDEGLMGIKAKGAGVPGMGWLSLDSGLLLSLGCGRPRYSSDQASDK